MFIDMIYNKQSYNDTLYKYLAMLRTGMVYQYNPGPYQAIKYSGLDKISNDSLRNNLIRFYDFEFPRHKELTTWSEVRGSAGAVHLTSWILPGGPGHPQIQHLLQHWVSRLPRCPWRWTFGERSKIGYLLPTWKKSRKSFTALGFNTAKGAWPYEAPAPWLSNSNSEEE